MRSVRVLLALTVALPLGCIPSNVVADEQRAVMLKPDELAWAASAPASLSGLYESVRIEGEIASGMWRVYYHFATNGAFSGAALILDENGPAFQTLRGRYSLADGEIRLGEDAEPARLGTAPDHLRISTADGTIVLRRAGD